MTYQDQLSPWVIHQLLPNLDRRVVIRFRRRTEAEAYLKILQQMRSVSQFAIAFDAPASDSTESTPLAPVPSTQPTKKSNKSTKKSSNKVTSATVTPVVSR